MQRIVLLAVAFAWWAAGASVAGADQAPSAAPLTAFTGHAHADVKVVVGGAPIELTAHVAVAERDQRSRFDVTVDRGQMPLLASGPFTMVLDRSNNTLTIWSDATKTYYVQSLVPSPFATPTPVATTTPRPARAAKSPFADLDVFTVNIQLAGRSTIIGFPSTAIATTMDVHTRGSLATTHVRATVNLADDFAMFPLTIAGSVDTGSAGVGGTFDYAVDDIVRDTPPLAAFAVPDGYQKADSPLGVMATHPAGVRKI